MQGIPLLGAFLAGAPAKAIEALTVLSAPVTLTDELALEILAHIGLQDSHPEAIIRLLRMTDFVAEYNDEWYLRDDVRSCMVKQLYTNIALFRSVHSLLLSIAGEEDDQPTRKVSVPGYLKSSAGVAYHLTAVDPPQGLDAYRKAFDRQDSGKGWLLGRLAEEQQKLGLLPADALEPAFISGISAYCEGRFYDAYEQLSRVADSGAKRSEVAVALHALGAIAIRREYRNRKRANLLLRRSLALFKELNDPRGQAQVLYTLARTVWLENRKEAESMLRQSLFIVQTLDDPSAQGKIMHALGRLTWYSSRTEAEEMLRRSLAICERSEDRSGLAQIAHTLGRLLWMENSAEAGRLLRRSIDIFRELGDAYGEAKALHTLGRLSWLRAPGESRTMLYRSFEIGGRVGQREHQCQVLNSLGNISRCSLKWELARHFYRRAVTMGRGLATVAVGYLGLSFVAERFDRDMAGAAAFMRQAIRCQKKTGRPDLVKMHQMRLQSLREMS